ncbi:MAG: 4-(cytidine 5'-diphospho)-2-C-methyl-D-erythritol kinase [Actinomycetota bacterium]|nr:4-(cytidine 5'-diphospho)-2-C-methyl-D-erythritol kinase [Actinomycetota bacterium]MDD5600604.1 4-(cytidine 5'-diphospho)-2-C-methyl-D-erythritol kinase [Actinomycetota bacterium]
MRRIIKLRASGKINLYLNVEKNGRNDGYHEIKSIMQSIGLSDELTFEIIERDTSVKFEGENGIYITCNNEDIPLDEKNLVHKAAALIMDMYDLRKKYSVKISIEKHIPVCAGLAGGSTNAAATLVALDKLFSLGMRMDDLINLAGKVGSDVPFCVKGGTILATGRGEKLSKLPNLPFYWVILATNGRKFLTKDVYSKFDLLGEEKKPIHRELVNNIIERNFTNFFKNLQNSLESVVTVEDKNILTIKERAYELGAIAAQMTGSGSTVFALCDDLATAISVYEGLKPASSKVFLTHTTPDSLTIYG